ncbi:unnamed protein product [Choristocarpus tenellus]
MELFNILPRLVILTLLLVEVRPFLVPASPVGIALQGKKMQLKGMSSENGMSGPNTSGIVTTAPVHHMGSHELEVPNVQEGYNLAGLLTVKRPDSNSVWVLCHGLCSSKDGTVPRFVSERIHSNTYRFDFGGCGDSGGDWGYAGYKRELSDLRAVVLLLRSHGWDITCILGHSKGAAAVLHYGERYDDVPLIVNVAGRFNMEGMPRSRFTEEQWGLLETEGSFKWNVKGQDLTIRSQDLEERAALDMRKTSGAIKKSEVLTIHGTEDEIIPVADASDFAQAVGCSHELVVVPGATHRFATPPEQDMVMDALSRRVPL